MEDFPSGEVTQMPPDDFECMGNLVFHCSNADAEELSNLLMGLIFKSAQDEHCTASIGEFPVQDLLKPFSQHIMLQGLIGFIKFRCRGGRENRIHFLTGFAMPRLITDDVATDPKCIGQKTELRFERAAMQPYSYESFLDNIVGKV